MNKDILRYLPSVFNQEKTKPPGQLSRRARKLIRNVDLDVSRCTETYALENADRDTYAVITLALREKACKQKWHNDTLDIELKNYFDSQWDTLSSCLDVTLPQYIPALREVAELQAGSILSVFALYKSRPVFMQSSTHGYEQGIVNTALREITTTLKNNSKHA